MISSLDALHEDMYFTGSDYFKNYGLRSYDVMLDAPGLILPQIHNKEGRPIFKVTLLDQLAKEPYLVQKAGQEPGTDMVICRQRERSAAALFISRLSYEAGQFVVTVHAEGVEKPHLREYASLLERGILSISREMANCDVIRFEDTDGVVCEAKMPVRPVCEKTKKITDINLHENELIGYDTYLEIIEELKQVPQIEVFQSAVSYTGRKLYAIWLKPGYEGYLSLTKRLSRVPSEIINARHHANEVSSTNAAFILLKRLLTTEDFRELPDKLNLVLVPMENVDGAAIHYELQKEHPYWKFHVARFNSLGKEFYYEHFQQDTIHTEAMGLSRLYERFAPDVLVDNHGVPSHEWEQQFSGYTSPSYKGFWLPRSLLYGYFWYVTDPEYSGNYPVNKRMEDVIADRIAEDDEMTALNREWSVQFEKYAHGWLPKLFPADYYKNMINYWIPFAHDPAHRYPSIRYPWITTVSYTSEVADETAQGEYLNLCARAHAAHDEVTIRMLMQAKCPQEVWYGTKDKIFARYLRLRPVVV
ncbi:M14 family metallopeptidase [Roseburia hominis]